MKCGKIVKWFLVVFFFFSSTVFSAELSQAEITTQDPNLDPSVAESFGKQKDFFIQKNFTIIDWETAQQILLQEDLVGGKQYHTGWLTIYCYEGKNYLVKPPHPDAVWEFKKEKGLSLDGFAPE